MEIFCMIFDDKEVPVSKKNGSAKRLSSEDFIRIWQKSENLADVLKATRLSRTAASMRASLLRGRGVPVKKFPRGRAKGWTSYTPDVIERLTKIAKASA